MEIVVRFIVGGLVVSAFAVIGNLFKPRIFAGRFGAAPSVALASLTLAASTNGVAYASVESRSMAFGAVAMGAAAWVCSQLMMRRGIKALPAAAISLGVWFVLAFLLWRVLLKG